jgi:hypothetical protein
MNQESELLAKAIPGAVEVKGADQAEHKEKAMLDFANGEIRVLVTKPSIAGFGMNWQHCSDMAFVGLSDSYEAFYQAVRRCWRFGQTRPAAAHIIISNQEGVVAANIKQESLIKYTQEITKQNIRSTARETEDYKRAIARGGGGLR